MKNLIWNSVYLINKSLLPGTYHAWDAKQLDNRHSHISHIAYSDYNLSIYEPPQLPSPTPIYFQVSLEKWWKKLHWNLRAQLNMTVFLSPTQGGLHCFRDEIPFVYKCYQEEGEHFLEPLGRFLFLPPMFCFQDPRMASGQTWGHHHLTL